MQVQVHEPFAMLLNDTKSQLTRGHNSIATGLLTSHLIASGGMNVAHCTRLIV
jgi:hypothetical protein